MEARLRSSTRTQYQDLIEENIHLVKAAVNRVAPCLPPEIDRGALMGNAIMALIETAYSTPPGQLFEQQARSNIWQSIVKWLGEQPWLLQRLKEAADLLDEAYLSFCSNLQYSTGSDSSLDVAQLASQLRVTDDQLEQWLREVTAYFTTWPRSFLGADEHDYNAQEIAQAISQLPPASRLVVTLSHYEELGHDEIAEVLDVSGEQVSRLYAEAGLRLRALLAATR